MTLISPNKNSSSGVLVWGVVGWMLESSHRGGQRDLTGKDSLIPRFLSGDDVKPI